jgi:hypothetical protein
MPVNDPYGKTPRTQKEAGISDHASSREWLPHFLLGFIAGTVLTILLGWAVLHG